jgi:hypothetical protein
VLHVEIDADIVLPSQNGVLLRGAIKAQDPKGVPG